MKHLFAYGTLMCEDIMHAVSGSRLAYGVGFLAGYRRLRVCGEDYPALVPGQGGQVEGIVYYDVSESAWSRLDRFEGEMYQQQAVALFLADDTPVSAVTYVARSACLDQLEQEEWSFEAFLGDGKVRFLKTYGGYDKL